MERLGIFKLRGIQSSGRFKCRIDPLDSVSIRSAVLQQHKASSSFHFSPLPCRSEACASGRGSRCQIHAGVSERSDRSVVLGPGFESGSLGPELGSGASFWASGSGGLRLGPETFGGLAPQLARVREREKTRERERERERERDVRKVSKTCGDGPKAESELHSSFSTWNPCPRQRSPSKLRVLCGALAASCRLTLTAAEPPPLKGSTPPTMRLTIVP
eukprot:scaffold1875_cov253-Pinguiococcus_pyrenoidosus.AAC.23